MNRSRCRNWYCVPKTLIRWGAVGEVAIAKNIGSLPSCLFSLNASYDSPFKLNRGVPQSSKGSAGLNDIVLVLLIDKENRRGAHLSPFYAVAEINAAVKLQAPQTYASHNLLNPTTG